MLYKKNKGVALVTVIIILMILSILGVSIISVSYFDSMNSIRQQKTIQAYNVARIGVEIGAKKFDNAINNAISSGKYYTDLEEFLNDTAVSGGLTNFNGTIANGTYNVSFIKSTDLLSNEMIKIYGEGVVAGVKSTTALSLKVTCPFINPNGWINNGWIVNDGSFSHVTGPVVFKTKKNLGHAVMKTGNNAETVFKAPAMYFLDIAKGFSLEVNKNCEKFTLESNMISFKTKVLIQNDGNGKLFLKVFEDSAGVKNGFQIPSTFVFDPVTKKYNGPFNVPVIPPGIPSTDLRRWGIIDLRNGLYYGNETNNHAISGFTPGFYYFSDMNGSDGSAEYLNLDKESDRSARMILVTDPDLLLFLDWYVKNDTNISIKLENSIWSKN